MGAFLNIEDIPTKDNEDKGFPLFRGAASSIMVLRMRVPNISLNTSSTRHQILIKKPVFIFDKIQCIRCDKI